MASFAQKKEPPSSDEGAHVYRPAQAGNGQERRHVRSVSPHATNSGADLIQVMDQGQVVQQGRHETLIKDLDGHYAQLLQESA